MKNFPFRGALLHDLDLGLGSLSCPNAQERGLSFLISPHPASFFISNLSTMIAKLVHYAADAVLVSAVLAGIKRSTVRTIFQTTPTRFSRYCSSFPFPFGTLRTTVLFVWCSDAPLGS